MSSQPRSFVLTQPGPIRLYSTEELLQMPPPTWLIKPILPSGGLVGLYGQPGSKKSFVALDIALSVASGRPWLDTYEVQKGYVVYIGAEGGTGIGKRVKAWLTHRQVGSSQLQIAWLIESIPVHVDSEQMELLLKRINDEIEERPSLIIIDTLARCFDGDENTQLDMGRFIGGIDTIRHTFGTTVLVVHHTRLDGDRERGNTAFRGAADTMIAQTSEDGNPEIVLECRKQKDAEHFTDLRLQLVTVPSCDSCVILSEEHEVVRHIKNVLKQAGKPLKSKELLHALSRFNISRATLFRRLSETVKSGEILKENEYYSI